MVKQVHTMMHNGVIHVTMTDSGIDRLRVIAAGIHITEIMEVAYIPLVDAIAWHHKALAPGGYHESHHPSLKENLQRLEATQKALEPFLEVKA